MSEKQKILRPASRFLVGGEKKKRILSTALVTLVIIGILGTSFIMGTNPQKASALCTGWHYDLTTEVMSRFGFTPGSDAIAWMQVCSYYADMYDVASDFAPWYSYLWFMMGETIDAMFPDDLRQMSSQCLHFNGIGQGGGVQEATKQWNDLVEATRRTVQALSSSHDGDEEILLTALGISLHKVQDFYAHTNWAGLGFNDSTWFDIPPDDRENCGLDGYGPLYDAVKGLQECDGPAPFQSRDNLFGQLAPHPQYPRVYRESFYASCQWVKLVMTWISDDMNDTPLWWKAANLANSDASWEADFWRRANAYMSRWKGETTGSDWDAIIFLMVPRYTWHHDDGRNPGQCMKRWWEVAPKVCARNLGVSAPDTLPRVPQQGWLTISTDKVGECTWAHSMGIDVGGVADFMAWITVNGRSYFEPEYINSTDFYPVAWRQQIPLDPIVHYGNLNIWYSLWDDDAPLWDAEHCAINQQGWDWAYYGSLADLLYNHSTVHTEGWGGYNEDQAYVNLSFSFYTDTVPVANAGTLYMGDEGSWITFDGSLSWDGGDGEMLRYRWDFDNDGVWDTEWSTSPKTAHRWGHETLPLEGHEIALQVTDGFHYSSDTAMVAVLNVAPVPNILADPWQNEGDIYKFVGPIYDEGWLDTWTVQWDFGDGTGASEGQVQNHIYSENGTYTVTYTVTDDGDLTGTKTFIATVNNVPPKVEAGVDQQATEGTEITFGGTFNDPGSLDTHTVHWDFGDGVTDDLNLSPKHAYGDNGTYTVSLTVVDDDGGVGSDTLTVNVNNAPPVPNITAVEQSNPVFVLAGFDTLIFKGSLTDPGWLDTHTALWSFGDGTSDAGTIVEENEAPNATARLTSSHLYAQSGQYTVTLAVTDDDGASAISQYVVTVVSPEEAIGLLDKWIQELPDIVFKKPASQTRLALSKKLAELETVFNKDSQEGVIEKLLYDIRAKMDGSLEGNSKDDWITDPQAQASLCAAIDDLITYLQANN